MSFSRQRLPWRLFQFCCAFLVAFGILWLHPVSTATEVQGQIIAALEGFDVKTHGFKFENYGNDNRTNLTAIEMQRMFGAQVCGNGATGQDCVLTPPAQNWMESQNKSMNGGHCEGMATLSLLMYSNQIKPSDFGADSVGALEIDNNEALQREIAYWFTTQATQPTQNSMIKIPPTEIVDRLTNAFQTKSEQLYALGIYKRGNPADGHAITPWGIEDLGDNKVAILSYDNNHPGVIRKVIVDREKNTWEYRASTNPNEPEAPYEGDAQTLTLEITPTPPRLQQQACAFCTDSTTASTKSLNAVAEKIADTEVWIEGVQNPLIVDSQGRRLGYVNSNLVKEIPGADIVLIRGGDLWKKNTPPVFHIPHGIGFSVMLDGNGLQTPVETSVDVFTPGYDLSVEAFQLSPGEKDQVTIAANGKEIGYTTNATESPTLTIGFASPVGADYEFDFRGVDLEDGGTINLKLDQTQQSVSLNTQGTRKPGSYEIVMDRIDETGSKIFRHNDIPLNPSDTAILQYGNWQGNTVPLGIDRGSKGSIDETLQLTTEKR
jgi:hypothetical protein